MKSRSLSRFAVVVAVLLGMVAVNAYAACTAPALDDLNKVGSTRLSVLFWDVYDAELFTDSGDYESYQQRALRLTYLRDIEAQELVETTQEEWERLDIAISDDHRQWLQQLNQMWPDITEGDCLLLVENEQGESVFYNAAGQLGKIPSDTFTDDFLAIWLSKNSRFKEERNELIGAKQ